MQGKAQRTQWIKPKVRSVLESQWGYADGAVEILSRHGAKVEDIDLPDDFSKVLDWHAALLAREGQSSFLGQYLTDKDKIHEENIFDFVENGKGYSRSYQLEAYDNCARLRPIFDDIARQYDAVITPSVVDVAPDISNTGDMVCISTSSQVLTSA